MKMKKSLVALCLSAGLLACAPAITFADVNFVPQNTSAAPAIPAAALQQLTWTRLINPKPSQPSFLLVANPERTGNYWPGCRL
jgi:ABC-type uncharacterized transport system auxiliary subunit